VLTHRLAFWECACTLKRESLVCSRQQKRYDEVLQSPNKQTHTVGRDKDWISAKHFPTHNSQGPLILLLPSRQDSQSRIEKRTQQVERAAESNLSLFEELAVLGTQSMPIFATPQIHSGSCQMLRAGETALSRSMLEQFLSSKNNNDLKK
jgi:hypothetical protein